ncbi:DUF3301 domain-containing protein [Glaciecola sp.]|nr:DUF3301 domain-containing protein [Glaciecola sp.]MDA7793765.1 DUF3301 domain-containing protein [Glaciecola sp.]
MTLLDILITVMIIALAASFWRVRDYAELARNNALQYCSKHQLVFVSVARRQIHWKESPEQRRFQFDYTMEFSTANDVLYEGIISIYKGKLRSIDLPVYRVPD